MDRKKVVLAAASTRILIGIVMLTLLPALYPAMADHRPIFVGYIAVAAVVQVMIWKGIGDRWRPLAGGLVDLALLTFIVQRAGSVATMMVWLYFFAGVVNTLVVGRREGMILSVLGALCYDAVLFLEHLGWIVYGPDAPSWAAGRPPSLVAALVAGSLMTMLLIGSTAIVGMLVDTLRTRERQLEEANTRLEELSQRDPLTHLYNRRHLMARIEEELARVRRGRPLCVVMIDLDRFKRVNDREGHRRGDELLQDLAAALADTTRVTDVAGRYGGDEFVIVLADTDRAQAEAAAGRLVAAVRRVGSGWHPDEPVTASAGLAVARSDDTPRGLLERADEAAYRAKAKGGDRVVLET